MGWGEQYVSASEAAIAIATGPFWFIAIDRKNWKSYFRDKFIPIGLLIGFTGLVIFLNGSVNESQHSITSNLQIMAFLVLALSSILWVLGSLHSKNNPSSHSKYMNIAQQLITAAIASFVVALIRGEWLVFSFSKVPTTAWLGLVFLVVFGSMVAYMSYIWLLSVQPAALVSTHTYINPIVTVMVGWIISNQVININQFYGLLIILLGVLLTNASKYFKLSNRSKVKIRRIKVKLIQIGSPYKPLIQLK
ncbi:MAG: putative inner membrane transporter YedA [Syntrophomonadaceae bacterium]|nr:putative inner membrane transporter YedA [Bacillota bacterium]